MTTIRLDTNEVITKHHQSNYLRINVISVLEKVGAFQDLINIGEYLGTCIMALHFGGGLTKWKIYALFMK